MQALKRILYAVIVIVRNKFYELRVESTFEFQYIPGYNTMTAPEKTDWNTPYYSGVEKRTFRTLMLLASATFVALSWVIQNIEMHT